MANVSLWNYSGRNTESYAVRVGSLTLYFSYQTVVAFRYNGKLVVRENDWGQTTGRHLNEIDGGDKSGRVSGEEFEKQLTPILDKLKMEE